MEENKISKIVFDAKIARKLCKRNFPIRDIKPMKGDPSRTVFVFDNTESFRIAFAEILDELKKTENPIEIAD